jgi:hypothetical protein
MKGGPEGEHRSGAAAGGVRPAFAASAAHDDLDGRGFSPTDVFAESLGERRRRFQFCIERFQSIGRLFLQLSQTGIFVILEARLPEPRTVSRRTRSCGSEASEPIPFPGADSIFSSRCGAISRRLPFRRRALSRRDPGDRNASVQKIDDRLGDLRRDGSWELRNFQRSKPVSASSPRNESPVISICYIESAKSRGFALRIALKQDRAQPTTSGEGLKSSKNTIALISFFRK